MENNKNIINKVLGNTQHQKMATNPQAKVVGMVISPNDPVFFRDAKPFTMGEEVHTTDIFPPYPSVFQGALRSVYFTKNPSETPWSCDAHDPTEKTIFHHAFLMYQEKLLFPFPSDVLVIDGECYPLKIEKNNKDVFLSSETAGTSHYLVSPQVGKPASTAGSYFLTEQGVQNYLDGRNLQKSDYLILSEENRLLAEAKVGIGRNEQMVTYEGKLFRYSRKRMSKDLAFYVAFEDLEIPNKGLLALGSDGVSATYEKTKQPLSLPACSLNWTNHDTVYKMLIVTPAPFTHTAPHIPPCLSAPGIRLLAYAIGRPLGIGGWDMKKNIPKALTYAVPSGSVYYFTAADEASFNQVKALHGKSLCEESFAKQGFGICLLGKKSS